MLSPSRFLESLVIQILELDMAPILHINIIHVPRQRMFVVLLIPPTLLRARAQYSDPLNCGDVTFNKVPLTSPFFF
jgi:hypothetical protein